MLLDPVTRRGFLQGAMLLGVGAGAGGCAATPRVATPQPTAAASTTSSSHGRGAAPSPTTTPTPTPTLRTWLAGFSGSGLPASRAAWAARYFPAQVWTAYLNVGTDPSVTGVASLRFNASQFLTPVDDRSVVNVLTIPLVASSASTIDPGGLRAAARGAGRPGWSALARAIVATGLDHTSTVLRIGHEPNGYWFPWCTNNDPAQMADYRNAWRRAHDAIRSVCRNVRFCLCLNKNLGGAGAIAGHYAGDAYVDLLGLDFYDFDHARTASDFQSTQGTCGFAEIAAFAADHGKQFSLDEWGVGGGPDARTRDNPFYVRSIYDALVGVQQRHCGIVAFDSYFNEANNFNLDVNPRSSAVYRSLWGGTGLPHGVLAAPTCRS